MKHRSLLFALALTAAAHGAEKIRYEEIPARIAPFGTTITGLGIKVTTVDGKAHKGQSMWVEAAQLELGRGGCTEEESLRDCRTEIIPSEQIKRIEIRRGAHAIDFTEDALIVPALYAGFCFWPPHDTCLLMPIGAGFLALAAASAPFTLAIDGVELLIPPKVYEIIH